MGEEMANYIEEMESGQSDEIEALHEVEEHDSPGAHVQRR
jgi:hypothetical protein